MNVLDPFEVAEIAIWPLDLEQLPERERLTYLNRAEFTLFEKVIQESSFSAVLNEKLPVRLPTIDLPKAYRKRIIPDSIYPQRKHPDIRIARRASTIASLARVISERKVGTGLRRTLLIQARRLEKLASDRMSELERSGAKGDTGVTLGVELTQTTRLQQFPLAHSHPRRARIEEKAKAVLAAREPHLPPKGTATLADLYDPLSMPPALLKAHADLDRAVEKSYRPEPFHSDRDRVEFLFALYEKLTTPVAPSTPPKRKRRTR